MATTTAEIEMPINAAERARRLRGRNLATLAGLCGLAALFFAITVVRVGNL